MSGQAQERAIGNPWELRAELGILRTQPLLLSAGFLSWSSKGGSPQPFLEGGWYLEHAKLVGGVQRAGNHNEALPGCAWDFNPRWRAQLNPALYRENGTGHALRAYVVASHSLALWNR